MNLFINWRDGMIHIPKCFLGRFPAPARKMSLKMKMSLKRKMSQSGQKENVDDSQSEEMSINPLSIVES